LNSSCVGSFVRGSGSDGDGGVGEGGVGETVAKSVARGDLRSEKERMWMRQFGNLNEVGRWEERGGPTLLARKYR